MQNTSQTSVVHQKLKFLLWLVLPSWCSQVYTEVTQVTWLKMSNLYCSTHTVTISHSIPEGFEVTTHMYLRRCCWMFWQVSSIDCGASKVQKMELQQSQTTTLTLQSPAVSLRTQHLTFSNSMLCPQTERLWHTNLFPTTCTIIKSTNCTYCTHSYLGTPFYYKLQKKKTHRHRHLDTAFNILHSSNTVCIITLKQF